MMHTLLETLGPLADRLTPRSPRTVLAVDEGAEIRRAITQALADPAYYLETAATAEGALQTLSHFHPELILVESQIRTLDGMPLARRLFAYEELIPVPVVALRGPDHEGAQGEFSPRFDGSIEKPIDPPTFVRQVRGFLDAHRRKPDKPPEEMELPESPPRDFQQKAEQFLEALIASFPQSQFAEGTRGDLRWLAAAVAGTQPDLSRQLTRAERLSRASTARGRQGFLSLIRFSQELLRGGPEVAPGLVELRSGYLDNRCSELRRLEDMLRQRDFPLLRKAGHNLKGTGAAYGFSELTDIGRLLETAAKDEDGSAVELLLDQIEAYIHILRPLKEDRGNHATGT